MNVGQTLGAVMTFLLTWAFNNATITFYSGIQPATPETPLSGNTALATWTINGATYTVLSGSDMINQIILSSNTATILNSGTATFARINAPNWAANTFYNVGQIIQTADGHTLYCDGAGTSPGSGTGPSQSNGNDGSGTDKWGSALSGAVAPVGPGIVDLTVGTSGTDIIVSSTTFTAGGGNSETLAFTFKLPVV